MTVLSITTTPAIAECRSILADGRVLTITASRRPRANRAEVKCSVPGAPAVAERMREVVRLARHTEARFDSRDQVVLSMDIAPGDTERDWELAAVLADRSVRGLFHPAAGARTVAHGWSDNWHLGRLCGRADGGAATVGTMQVTHLGALTGHADPSAAVSTVRAWFPLHSGGVNDELAWVEVSVFPIDADPATADVSANATHTAAVDSEEDSIAAPGLDLGAQQDIRQTLAGARHFDGKGLGRWRSVVRFGQPRFQGGSYQLALVMADRLARGREFVPRGRIIATGCSSAWHAGRVDTVEGREPKLELILRQVGAGDRVLLPKAWEEGLPPGFQADLRQKGATLACIDRIGMI
ncbi:hypothetical protein SAMN05428959_104533 [Duganella sp. CF517]|uniref:hypothetical protein n=1 Tax=Duganella sp. CF517 TaxID=1881038 RepID=UPI0008BEAD67|nr:hypothetical protein [Duganella sp. CF517]SEO07708.1 hypothetical protein SAMN05428959_104533 [Duganella sp. CF517]